MLPRGEEGRSSLPKERPSDRRRAVVGRRSVLIGTVVGVPASTLLLWLSLRHVDADALRSSLAGADVWKLVIAVAVIGCVYVTQSARWRLIAGSPRRAGFRRFLEWVLGSLAVNNVVPGRPGDLLRVEWLARGAVVQRARALGTVMVDRGLDVAALVALFAITYWGVPHPTWVHRLGIATGSAALLLIVLAVGARAYSRRHRLPARRLGRIASDLAHEIQLRLRGRRGVAAALLSLLAWGLWSLAAWLVASSLGISLSPLEALFVTSVLNLGVAIPSSPGYIGTFQWLSVSALGVLDVERAPAFAFSVLMHAAWFIPTTLAGVILVLRKVSPVLAKLMPNASSGANAA